MFGGMLAVVVCGCWQMGGIGRVFSAAKAANRIEFSDLDVSPLKRHSVWSLVLGGSVTWLVIYGSNQSQVQRALWLNLPGLILLLFLCGFAGLVAYTRYKDCDPLSVNLINKNDQILPFYVIDNFGHIPGFTGLFVASIFSGAMSTLSSGVNALVTVTLEDFIKPYSKIKFCTENDDSALFSKFLVVGYGTVVVMIAMAASTLGNLIQACFSLFGSIGGPIMATFLLGMLCSWATWKGALSGLIVGEVMSVYQASGSYVFRRLSVTAPLSTAGCINETGNLFMNRNFSSAYFDKTLRPANTSSEFDFDLYHISYMYQGVWAVLWTLTVSLVVSLFSNGYGDANREITRYTTYLFFVSAFSNKCFLLNDMSSDNIENFKTSASSASRGLLQKVYPCQKSSDKPDLRLDIYPSKWDGQFEEKAGGERMSLLMA
uniref:Sodium-coupled monocarboxylate transporter 1 n=1 Tax=Romanomermis culicivorax TaxID=13658 RepID=A0A915J7G4_ROMCU